MSHEHTSVNPEALFAEQSHILASYLKQSGGEWAFTASQPELDRATRIGKAIVCIDEGTVGTGRGLPLAGAGILQVQDGNISPLAERLAPFVESGEIEEVLSHDGCGAAMEYCRRNGIDLSEATDRAIEHAIKLAEVLSKLTGKQVTAGHIHAHEMTRPASLHNAVGAFVGAPINPQAFKNLRAFGEFPQLSVDASKAEEEIAIAGGIALGDHGFAKLFDEEHPFAVIPVGSRRRNVDHDQMRNLALKALRGNEHFEAGRIIVAQGITDIDQALSS